MWGCIKYSMRRMKKEGMAWLKGLFGERAVVVAPENRV